MKKHLIIIYALLASVGASLAQNGGVDRATSTIRRPVFTGGGITSQGTAITGGQPFSGNRCVAGASGTSTIVQIGAQIGVDTNVANSCVSVKAYSLNTSAKPDIVIAPNPFLNQFNIYPFGDLKENSKCSYQLYSSTGNLIKEGEFYSSEVKLIDVSLVSSSFCLIRIYNQSGKLISSQKLIKNN